MFTSRGSDQVSQVVRHPPPTEHRRCEAASLSPGLGSNVQGKSRATKRDHNKGSQGYASGWSEASFTQTAGQLRL